MYHLYRQQWLNCHLEQAWSFFSSPRNLDRLTPKSVGFKITHLQSEQMHPGQIITYKIKVAPMVWLSWMTEITQVVPMDSFIDDQRLGPYKVWHHCHKFKEQDGGVLMSDEVNYAMPFGPLGKLVHKLYVKQQLQHIFDERARLCDEIFNAATS
ncbi:SRPBCC family protein [Verrucomicrobiaceae bacterium N1E253]|uniref:SRPBCC family protein n=1 Tax=Oceaniferula marina TaxID=2748318 RepID=A0A851G8P5_9BACT|nr:SRPBCC family protein [Oceaniferula marina]NWK54088.1 SRPBCC family protein [Oceaniferula marina]